MEIIYVILAILFLVIIMVIFTYNSLIARRNDVKNTYSSIDVELQQRYDLIPNLIASIKAYFEYEKDTLENIVKLRENAMYSNNTKDKFALNNELSKALGNLNIKLENYPDLKANSSVNNLLNALKDCEEQISAARRAYNSAVTSYNNYCESFPNNLIANAFNFIKADFYEVKDEIKSNPNVKDLFK